MVAEDCVTADAATAESTGGVVSFETVTTTFAAVAVLPAASRATAVSVWLPLAAPVVFHDHA